MRLRSDDRRTGAALMWTLVVLSVLTVTSGVAVREFLMVRGQTAHRRHRIQAEWLARSGVELAAARLLADDGFAGEAVEPIANGPVRIVVSKDAGKPGSYQIRCDATYPADDPRPIRVTLTRTATRRTDGKKVTVDLAAGSDAPPGP